MTKDPKHSHLNTSTVTHSYINTSQVTRFEVIDETGRILVRKDQHVELSFQDDNRTLKVFLSALKSKYTGGGTGEPSETFGGSDY